MQLPAITQFVLLADTATCLDCLLHIRARRGIIATLVQPRRLRTLVSLEVTAPSLPHCRFNVLPPSIVMSLLYRVLLAIALPATTALPVRFLLKTTPAGLEHIARPAHPLSHLVRFRIFAMRPLFQHRYFAFPARTAPLLVYQLSLVCVQVAPTASVVRIHRLNSIALLVSIARLEVLK
jgi:hypothetical protein